MKRSRLLRLLGLEAGVLCGLSFLGSSHASNLAITGNLFKKQLLSSITGNLSEKLFLTHQGQSRSYRIYGPELLPETPCAAVLLLHGNGGSADQLIGVTGQQAPHQLWMPIADREHLILIIPDGLVGPNGKPGWNDARNIASNPDSDDVAFLNNLVETVAESYPIDFQRVYATGMSNGGHMALRLAAEVPEKFAAVAAVAAANPDPIFVDQPQYSISVLLMNGTDDQILPYEGGEMSRDRGKVQSTDDSIQYWVTHNNCEKIPRFSRYTNQSRTDGCTASRTTYSNLTTNVEVSLVRIRGGGHTEPSISQPYSRLFLAIVGAQNQDIEMADEVWKFFQDKSTSL
ncbi:MAG: hypothetical protein KTR27_02490 [Leptolyngbyaceae cyanobacterium MAG.088]|nr:hypothetical protein [Leptolyngbyaceae cyanobacterium MAG.088]